MEPVYKASEVEEKIYKMWEENGYFTPKMDPKKEPFTILLPPPNANDPLHMGHALYVVEDILARFHRMKGDPTLWLPGFDHAGIETQFVFEKKLRKEDKSRFDFDRETLFKMISDYVNENRGVAKSQLKKLGFSLDWTREKYTMDPSLLKTVNATFNKMHKDGLLYRKKKVVNFCPRCGTSYSNLEVDYSEEVGALWYIRYPIINEKQRSEAEPSEATKERRRVLGEENGYITVATTRPETMLGDTAVAVSPKDKRYKNLVGKTCILPLVGREIPIISDSAVDKDFGAGALKVTPAHSIIDEEIAGRHDLPSEVVIGQNGKMELGEILKDKSEIRSTKSQTNSKSEIQNPKQVQEEFLKSINGMKIEEARMLIIEELKKLNLLEKEEKLTHSVGHCYRCGKIIEQLPLPQWFVKIEPLAKPAIAAVKKKEIKIVPARFEKIFLQWMENIRDWNISRQIVWGPRVPVWYCLKCNPEINISFINKKEDNWRGEASLADESRRASQLQEKSELISGTYGELSGKYSFDDIKNGLQELRAPENASYILEERCKECGSQEILQETDTFDTWFSSGQWPLTTLNYPEGEDFKYFYPTTVLDTMWDILFFWVARMIMFGLYLTKDLKDGKDQVPFKFAHMHSRVVDKFGAKMSKSKNNAIDPLLMVDKYGADALRMALVYGIAPGSDISVSEDKIRAYRNFANKIWNASRFVLSHEVKLKNLDSSALSLDPSLTFRMTDGNKSKLKAEDKEILEKLEKTKKLVTSGIEKYRFGLASEEIYQFFWHEFCDKYIESVKGRLNAGGEDGEVAAAILFQVLTQSLKLLHPFMPFVTEEIWQKLREVDSKLEKSLMIAEWK